MHQSNPEEGSSGMRDVKALGVAVDTGMSSQDDGRGGGYYGHSSAPPAWERHAWTVGLCVCRVWPGLVSLLCSVLS